MKSQDISSKNKQMLGGKVGRWMTKKEDLRKLDDCNSLKRCFFVTELVN